MRSSIFFALLLLCGCASTGAHAQAPASELAIIRTFTAICLQHLGDAKGQETTATADPWQFAPIEGEPGAYRSSLGKLGIFPEDRSCAVTSVAAKNVTLISMISAMTSEIGTNEGQTLDEDDSKAWLIAGDNDEEFVLALSVSIQSGQNLVTLWAQPRVTLNGK